MKKGKEVAQSFFSCKDTNLITLAEEDLKKDNLSLTYAASNGVDIYNAKQCAPFFAALNAEPFCDGAIIYKYIEFKDNKWQPIPVTEFVRFKPLYKLATTGFAAQSKDHSHKAKYLQIGSGSKLYVPTFYATGKKIDWTGDDISPLIICEGEKKALSAANAGLLAVGLAGKDNYYISRNDKTLLPELMLLARKRLVYIVFDVDEGHVCYKPEVAKSVNHLAAVLAGCGAQVRITTLPSRIDEKTEIGNWLSTLPPSFETSDIIEELVKYSSPHRTAELLHAELNRLVYVEILDAVCDITTREPLPIKNYKTSKGNIKLETVTLAITRDKDLGTVVRTIPHVTTLAMAFLESHARPTVYRADLFPGRLEPVVVNDGGDLTFNLWPGWMQKLPPIPATRKDISIFFEFLEGFHGADAEYMVNWYLWPLKHCGDKLFTIPVLRSIKEGIGKSTMSELLGKYVYRREFVSVIGADKLDNRNFKVELVGGAMLAVIDDADDVSLSSTLAVIKHITTAETIAVTYKYMNMVRVRNYANIIVSTNRERPFTISKFDRRFRYVECSDAYLTPLGSPPHNMFERLHKWFGDGGGAKLVSYAQHSHDFGEFNPKASAEVNDAKLEQIELSETLLVRTMRRLIEDLQNYDLEIFTFSQIKLLVENLMMDEMREQDRKPSYAQIAAALREVGAESLGIINRREGDNESGKTTYSVYAVKNLEYWKQNKHDKELIHEQLNKPFKIPTHAKEVKRRKTESDKVIQIANHIKNRKLKY